MGTYSASDDVVCSTDIGDPISQGLVIVLEISSPIECQKELVPRSLYIYICMVGCYPMAVTNQDDYIYSFRWIGERPNVYIHMFICTMVCPISSI